MTTKRAYFLRGLVAWLAVSVLCCALLYAEQIRRQYWQFDRAFGLLFSTLSTALTQNESVIPVLSGDEDLSLLQQKFPQIQALEKTVARPLDAPRVETLSPTGYWLYNPYRQIRVRITLVPLLKSASHFSTVRLSMATPEPLEPQRWQWAREFQQHFQPFTLQASASPRWFAVSWLPHVLVLSTLGALISLLTLTLWGRRQQQTYRQRADYYQHARLNTLGEMAAGVVHEINQPLTATQMWLQGGMRQLDNGKPEEARHAMRSALTQTQRISDLLTRFRAHLSQEAVALTAVNLSQSWLRVGNLLEHEPGTKHIRISHAFKAPEVRADRLWLEQVLHNLLNNAIQAQLSSGKGWVHIASEAEGERVRVTLTDGGPGFSPQALKLALMPLYTEREGGLGLGLTLCESLMTRMNGSLQLANRPDGGAEISLWFIRER